MGSLASEGNKLEIRIEKRRGVGSKHQLSSMFFYFIDLTHS